MEYFVLYNKLTKKYLELTPRGPTWSSSDKKEADKLLLSAQNYLKCLGEDIYNIEIQIVDENFTTDTHIIM